MKKITIALLFLTSAQASSQKKFAIFFGVNNSFFSENRVFGAQDIEPAFGKQVGVLYNMPLNNTISFRPKLMYSEQGDRYDDLPYNGIVPIAYNDRLSYLNAAMDFKFWNKIYVLAGPQIGILLSEQTPYETQPAKSYDFGVNLGLGVRVHDWFFELGAYTGLIPVIENQRQLETSKLFNAHSKFTVGYHIF